MEDAIYSVSDGRFGGVGGSVRAVKPTDETVARHFPGDFVVN